MMSQKDFLSQLRMFLVNTVKEVRPELVITIKRKGTALLRALIEKTDLTETTELSWKNVLSSSALHWVDQERLRDKRILLFDDLVYEGDAMRRELEKFKHRKIPCSITKAAFAVHQRCPSGIRPEFYYYSEVGDEQYDNLRNQIVRFLQWQGALLLDTEHIEIPIKLHCSREEFFNALRSSGDSAEFLSVGNRVSLTICNPILLDQRDFHLSLPRGTIFDNVVCKGRVIERPDNKYALIPIYYPSLPTQVQNGWYQNVPPFLRNHVGTSEKDKERNFYAISLLAGLEVVKGIFSCLSNLLADGKIVAELPQPDTKEDILSHLLVLYPDMSIPSLYEEVSTAIEEGRAAGKTHKAKKGKVSRYIEGEDFLFEKTVWPVLTRIWELTELASSGPIGASFPEILDCGKKLEIAEAVASATLDKTIDEGFVLTGIETAVFPDSVERTLRVFRPDGEKITSLVRRYVSML